jgi:hypothetical protein
MNLGKVRTLHRGLGISIACFLFVQAVAGLLMSVGMLASVEMSPWYNVLYFIHADWNPAGSIYRVVLGLGTAVQGVLGMIIFLSLYRFKKKKDTLFRSADQPYPERKEVRMHALSFAADIGPLFRDSDIKAMKPMGIDLSSYADVKKRAHDIYARLIAKEMPCDGGWGEDRMGKFKQWVDGGMLP